MRFKIRHGWAFPKSITLSLCWLALLLAAGAASAATCTSRANGNWGSSSTWTCGATPASGDTVILASPYTVTLDNSYTTAVLTINSGATLSGSGSNTLTVTGNLTNNGTFTSSNSDKIGLTGNAAVISGTGIFANQARLHISGTAPQIAAGAALNFTGSSRLYAGYTAGGSTVSGSVLTVNGTINSSVGSGTTTFLRLYANSTVVGTTGVINAPTSAVSYNTGSTKLTNNGSVSVQQVTQNASSNAWTQGTSASLTVAASSSFGTLNASAAGNTVTYNSPATPSTPSSNTYYNLAGSGVSCPHGFIVLGSDPCLTAPTAATRAASALGPSGATLNGTVSSNGAITTVTFEYGLTVAYGSTVNAVPSPLAATSSSISVSAAVAGLTCNTVYHFRVKAVNSLGTSYGLDFSLTTTLCVGPTVTTNAATAVTASGATLNGTVNDNGSATTTTFEYGTTLSYGTTVPGPTVAAGAGSTPVAVAIAGLACNRLYNFRVKGLNSSASTVNGANATFTTAPCAPTATTGAASAVTVSGATLNGTVSSNGAITTVTFEYGPTTAYGTTASATPGSLAANSSNSPVSVALTGLNCGTTYHFRVAAVNSAGTSYGADQGVTTTSCPLPAVSAINTSSTNPALAGTAVNWTVSFNTSVTGVDATDFQLSGVAGAAITSVTGSGTSYSVTASTAVGAAGSLKLNLVDNDSIVNTAGTPLGGVGPLNGDFLAGQSYTMILPSPVLTKGVSSSAAVVNNVLTFDITAANPYSVDMSAVTVSDVLPAGITYLNNLASTGSVGTAGQTVTWTIPALAAGASATLTLVVKVTAQGSYTNTVTSPGSTPASATVLVLPFATTHYKMDGTAGSWSGAAGEVIDSGGTLLHGTRVTTSTPTTTNQVNPGTTIASQYASVVGGFCNAASFDGKAVVRVAHSPLFDYTTRLSGSAWIYPTAYPASGNLASILSNDQNYEFHLDPAGKLYWWWGGTPRQLTSAATIPLNRWTHIAITMDASAGVARQRIYVNGLPDTNTNNWTGTLATNTCPFYLGGDIATDGACTLLPARNFRGTLDEVKLYNYELTQSEVQADMTLGRNCAGVYDHIEISHDGVASVCTPEAVTLKVCLNASCSMLYPGDVAVQMSPTGWAGGDTVTISNGVGTASLSNATAGNVTLGTISSTPGFINPARCFKGGTETCVMNFASASCALDAVEPSANPKTRLFTKMTGVPFTVDVLALNGAALNTTYAGTVNTDLVDASASSCPTGAGLTAAQPITFIAANGGRRPATFTYAGVAKDVRVRMTVGASTPACSTDNFAIRPSSVSLTTTPVMATPPSATATPVLKAGSSFTLNAAATAGYSGTLTLDNTRLTAQTTVQDTTMVSGGAIGNLTPTTLAVNAAPAPTLNASYDEVGYLYLGAGALRDEIFTAVDQPASCQATNTCDCVTDTTSNNNLSTALVGATGRYGCHVGNTAVAMGRFIPDHFGMTGASLQNRSDLGANASLFTYMDEPMKLTLNVAAYGKSETLTRNYAGVFAKLNVAGGLGNNTANWTCTSGAQCMGLGAVNGTTALTSRLAVDTSPAASNTAWSAGASSFTVNVKLARATGGAPDGPYQALKIAGKPLDADGVTLPLQGSIDMAHCGSLDVTTGLGNPACFLGASPAPAEANLRRQLFTTDVRFGRLKLSNAYGSEKKPLQLQVQSQYWSGNSWVLNSADDLTTLPVNAIALSGSMANKTSASAVVIDGGKGSLVLANPNPGNPTPLVTGSVDVAINLGSSNPDNSCLGPRTTVPLVTIGANLPWLRSQNGNCASTYDTDPSARGTFGIYSPETRKTIHIRELY